MGGWNGSTLKRACRGKSMDIIPCCLVSGAARDPELQCMPVPGSVSADWRRRTWKYIELLCDEPEPGPRRHQPSQSVTDGDGEGLWIKRDDGEARRAIVEQKSTYAEDCDVFDGD